MRSLSLLLTLTACLLLTVSTARGQSFLERLENALQSPAAEVPADGEVESGYLGLTADESGGTGVVVVEAKADSPAARAGLAAGDVIVAIDGRGISTLDDMAARLANHPAGKKLDFVVLRQGDQRVFEVTLGQRPGEPAAEGQIETPAEEPQESETSELPAPRRATSPPPPRPEPLAGDELARPRLGVTVVDLTEELRRQYNVGTTRGALVTAVQDGSPADRYRIPVGAAIVAADGLRIDGYQDLVRYIASRRAGDAVELIYYDAAGRNQQVVRLGGEAGGAAEERFRVGGTLDTPPRDGGDRPAGRILGRVLENLAPAIAPAIDSAVEPSGIRPADEVHELREQVQAMQSQIDALQQRLAEVEKLLAAEPESEDATPDANPR